MYEYIYTYLYIYTVYIHIVRVVPTRFFSNKRGLITFYQIAPNLQIVEIECK